MAANVRKSASRRDPRTAIFLSIAILLFGSAGAGAFAASAAEPARLRISIPGLGSSSYPLIMAQKKGYFRAEGYEVELIRRALKLTSGNQARAARLLGVKATTLNSKIKRYGLLEQDFI